MPFRSTNIEVNDLGEATIYISADGLPSAETLVPAPMVSEVAREARVEEQKESLWLEGYFITAIVRVRNPVFDKPGEKSTTKIKFRVCKTEAEAKYVLSKVKAILEREVMEVHYGRPSR